MSTITYFLNHFGTQIMVVPFRDRNKSDTEIPKTPKTLKPDKISKTFGAMNRDGDYGLFFLVNESSSPTKRRKEDIVRARAVWVEDDEKRDHPREDWPIPPNLVVNSSPGKYHYYWLTSTDDLHSHQEVMQTMVDDYGCDPNARDISRVLRIPGFFNLKYEKPHPVTYFELDETPYSWDEIKEAFPPSVISTVNRSTDDSSSFDLGSAIASITKGENYHNSMTSIALHYANYGMSRDQIKKQLLALQAVAPQDERAQSRFSDQHLYECIDSAIKIAACEQVDESQVVTESVYKSDYHIDSKALDKSILMPENFLFGKLVQAIYSSAHKKNLMSAFIAAVSSVSYLAGGAYRIVGLPDPETGETKDRLKVATQQIGLGVSGVGKDSIVKGAMSVIDAVFAGQPKIYDDLISNISTSVGSRQGIEDCLLSSNRHDFLQVMDECGSFFGAALSKPGTPTADLLGLFLETFSAQNIAGRKLAKSKVQGAANPNLGKTLYNVCIVLCGASTPERFARNMSSRFVEEGCASRMMIHNCDPYKERRRYNDKVQPITKDVLGEKIVENLQEIADHERLQMMSGVGLSLPSVRAMRPISVKIDSEETDKFFFNECVEYYETMLDAESKAIYSRIDINARVIAALIAILENPNNPVITLEMAKISVPIVKSSASYLSALFNGELMAESEHAKLIQTVADVLKEYYPKSVTKTVLRNSRLVIKNARTFDRDNAIKELLSEGLIEETKFMAQNARRPTTAYVWVGTAGRIAQNEKEDAESDV
jgi:hypothetical protein